MHPAMHPLVHKAELCDIPVRQIVSLENKNHFNQLFTGRRHDGDRWFIKWTRFFLKAGWLNIRRKCCKACGTATQERYCLI